MVMDATPNTCPTQGLVHRVSVQLRVLDGLGCNSQCLRYPGPFGYVGRSDGDQEANAVTETNMTVP